MAWRAGFGLFRETSKPAVVRSFVAHSTHSLSAKVNAATARNGIRSGGTSHPRSIRIDDGSPAVSRLRGYWMVRGAYDCLYVTRLLARRHRVSPHWRFSAPRGCHIKRPTCLLTSPLHHVWPFGAPHKLDAAHPIRRRAVGTPEALKRTRPTKHFAFCSRCRSSCVLSHVPGHMTITDSFWMVAKGCRQV